MIPVEQLEMFTPEEMGETTPELHYSYKRVVKIRQIAESGRQPCSFKEYVEGRASSHPMKWVVDNTDPEVAQYGGKFD